MDAQSDQFDENRSELGGTAASHPAGDTQMASGEATEQIGHDRDTAAPLDFAGTRCAPRFSIVDGVAIQIDGKPASLVNLSLVGAQVLSARVLRPRQGVRITLVEETTTVRIQGVVAVVTAEMSDGMLHYRAGIAFVDPDQAALGHLIERNRIC